MPTGPSEDGSELDDTLSVVPALSSPGAAGARQIGPYRLVHLLGEGGMGEVWLAEQREPIRRRVALKIVKAGMDTKQVVARFESERQALALMDHPCIAKVHDAGATPEGRPYFVMEHVPGVPITEHCDIHKLSTAERLLLLAEVCEGVQHAHQKAIIHRDLKPSNILVALVDGKPQPKIIDFGIAKATGYRLTERTLFTEVGAFIGTPEYMSPEQADLTAHDVDTRTDVYALGVILYQLLTGELPVDSKELRASGYDELRRKLRETEPPKPSTRLSTLGDEAAEAARRRSTDPGVLRRQLKGDLDAIAMKALEKDRRRRYGTPTELAEDLRRHLRREPVHARAPSTVYRIRKYVARHSVGVIIASGLLALLVAFAASTWFQARRTAQERDRANRERDTAQRASAFLASMLSTVKPDVLGEELWKELRGRVADSVRATGGSEAKVNVALASLKATLDGVSSTGTAVHLLDHEILERAAAAIERDMKTEPRLAASLEYALGMAYQGLGLETRAEGHLRRAIALQTQELGPEHLDTIQSMRILGWSLLRQARYDEAEEVASRVLQLRQKLLGPAAPATLLAEGDLANVYSVRGKYQEAETLWTQNLEQRRRVFGPEHKLTFDAVHNLAFVYLVEHKDAAAEPLLVQALEGKRRVYGPEDPETLGAMNHLGNVYFHQGRAEEAIRLLEEASRLDQKVLGPDNQETLSAMGSLAQAYQALGRVADAERLYERVLAAERRVLGPSHDNTLATVNNLADTYLGERRYAEAVPLFEEALAGFRRTLGPEHPSTVAALCNLAEAYGGVGRHAESEQLARQAVAGFQRVKMGEFEGVAHRVLGRALLELGRHPEAEAELLQAERLTASDSTEHRRSMEDLARLYERWDAAERGHRHASQATRWRTAVAGK